jgi:hypothetical protein
LTGGGASDELAAAAEFVLEGLHARKLIARSEERGFGSAGVEEETAPRRRWN